MLLRVVCTDDVEHVVVVRGELVTAVVRPRVIDLVDVVEQTHALLTDEEAAIVRCVFGAHAESYMVDYLASLPRVSCPCFIPGALRSGVSDWSCPLHGEAPVRPARTPLRARFYALASQVECLVGVAAPVLPDGFRLSILGLFVALIAPHAGLPVAAALT